MISFFKLELYKRKITSEFIINASKIVVKDGFLTNKINTAFRRPYDKKFVQVFDVVEKQREYDEEQLLKINKFPLNSKLILLYFKLSLSMKYICLF